MLSDFLQSVLLQIRISHMSCATAYKFDKKLHRLIYETGKWYTAIYKVGRFTHYAYSTFMLCSFIHMFLTASNDGITIDQVLSIGWICCHVGSGILCAGVAHKQDALMRLFNSFLEFEEQMGKGEQMIKDKSNYIINIQRSTQ
jgi:hypothetical protein